MNTRSRLLMMRQIDDDTHKKHIARIDTIISGLVDAPLSNPLRIDAYTLPVTPPASLWYIAQGHTWSRSNLGGHTGLDINLLTGGDSDLGQPVYSTCNGLVVYAQKAPGAYWGNLVVVQGVGANGLEFWRYAHLNSIDVQVGDYVLADDSVGTIGKGGQRRYWAHLHLDCWRGGIQSAAAYRNRGGGWIDPLDVWLEAGTVWGWGER